MEALVVYKVWFEEGPREKSRHTIRVVSASVERHPVGIIHWETMCNHYVFSVARASSLGVEALQAVVSQMQEVNGRSGTRRTIKK